MKHDDLRLQLLTIALIGVAVWLRLTGLERDIWIDEYSSISLAQSPHLLSSLRGYDHPPLYFVLLRAWLPLGAQDTMLRLLSVLFGVATVLVMLWWMSDYEVPATFVAGVLATTLPILLRYSQEIRDYGLLLLLVALAFRFASRIIATPARWPPYVGLAVSLSLAVTTHLVGVFVIASVALYIVLSAAHAERLERAKLAAALALPLLTFAALYFVFLAVVRQRSAATWVAVGMALTGHPPHRSQRAELPHWAPALGPGVEA